MALPVFCAVHRECATVIITRTTNGVAVSARSIENVKTPEAIAEGVDAMMKHVQVPWRPALRTLLEKYPVALKCFADMHPYEAFRAIVEETGEDGVFWPFENQDPVNVSDFLAQRLMLMPPSLRYEDEGYGTM